MALFVTLCIPGLCQEPVPPKSADLKARLGPEPPSLPVIHVPGQYPSIQQAIDAVTPMVNIVLVAPGTYSENILIENKAITIRSDIDGKWLTHDISPENTIIDGEQQKCVRILNCNSHNVLLEGFTITNGQTGVEIDHASPTLRNNSISHNDNPENGGGIYCINDSEALIENNIITENSGTSGGGIYTTAPTTITGNIITNNESSKGGGGIYCGSTVEIINNRISGNTSYSHPGGGGIYHAYTYLASSTITNNIISGNGAPNTSSGGGGMRFDNNYFEVSHNIITGNCGFVGGGVWEIGYKPKLISNVIAGNLTYRSGGGIKSYYSYPTFLNNLIAGNRADRDGGGFASFDSYAKFTNNTIVNNLAAESGGGIHFDGLEGSLTNSILWNNRAPVGPEIVILFPPLTTTYCNVEGGWPGTGNIDIPPLFSIGQAGNWTENGSYNPQTHEITFTDSSSSWIVDKLAGKLINPDSTQALQLYIVSNTTDTITVLADWNTIDPGISWVSIGDSYHIYDYHLKEDSPCIDAGNNYAPYLPSYDFDGDPRRFDMPLIPDTGNGNPPLVDIGYDEVVE